MALRWEWTDKVGYVRDKYNQLFTIYKGNAEAIILFEKDDKWNLHFFICDKEHHKNMVKDDCYSDFDTWYLSKEHKQSVKLAKLLVEAKQNIKFIEKIDEVPW